VGRSVDNIAVTCRRGTSAQGLAGMGVLGWRLDLMILEVFSNLNDSMILWFCDIEHCEEEAGIINVTGTEKKSSSNGSWFMFMQQAGSRDVSGAKVL